MPIKYNVIAKGQPGVAGGGTKKFYASSTADGEVTLDSLTTDIEKISTVSGADIRAVLYALVDIIPDKLADSKIIRLGELGSFQISVSSNGEETEEDVSARSIKGSKINFRPGSKLRNMLKTLTYQKA
ncbi:MAG: hypothetical protein RIC80_04890 [Cyclobacteriaceae bacterium]